RFFAGVDADDRRPQAQFGHRLADHPFDVLGGRGTGDASAGDADLATRAGGRGGGGRRDVGERRGKQDEQRDRELSHQIEDPIQWVPEGTLPGVTTWARALRMNGAGRDGSPAFASNASASVLV